MRFKYCPECGSVLKPRCAGDDGLVPYCKQCEKMWFDMFSSCVLVLTYNEYDEVVLARQSTLSDRYASFTSGYITPGESAERAALREVREELGIELQTLEFAGTYWFERKQMLMCGFIGYAQKTELKLSEEIDSAEWTAAKDVPKTLFPENPQNAAYAIYRKFLEMRGIQL